MTELEEKVLMLKMRLKKYRKDFDHILKQSDIDKATAILDMISFTKENGRDIILIQVGDNVEIKITK